MEYCLCQQTAKMKRNLLGKPNESGEVTNGNKIDAKTWGKKLWRMTDVLKSREPRMA